MTSHLRAALTCEGAVVSGRGALSRDRRWVALGMRMPSWVCTPSRAPGKTSRLAFAQAAGVPAPWSFRECSPVPRALARQVQASRGPGIHTQPSLLLDRDFHSSGMYYECDPSSRVSTCRMRERTSITGTGRSGSGRMRRCLSSDSEAVGQHQLVDDAYLEHEFHKCELELSRGEHAGLPPANPGTRCLEYP